MIFGDLNTDSFSVNNEGWSALYSDSDLESKLSLTKNESLLTAEYEWQSHKGFMRCPPKLQHLIQFFEFTESWDALLNELITKKYNAKYFAYQEDSRRECFLPDGPSFIIACPVNVSKLHAVLSAINVIENDTDMVSKVVSYLSLTLQVVNYIQGKNPNIPSRPDELKHWVMESTGLPPIETPVLENSNGNSSAITTRCPIYYLIVSCFFRDIFRVLEHLHKEHLIGDAPQGIWEERSYQAPEFSTLIFHSSEEFSVNINYFDTNGTRRVFLPHLVENELYMEIINKELNSSSENIKYNAERKINTILNYSKKVFDDYKHLENKKINDDQNPGILAINIIRDLLQIDDEWSVQSDNHLYWVGYRLQQYFDASPPFEDEGILLSKVQARTKILENVSISDEDAHLILAQLNHETSMNSLIYNKDEKSLWSYSTVYVHSDTLDWRSYQLGSAAILQLCEAEERAEYLAKSFNGNIAIFKHPNSGRRETPDDMLGCKSKLYIESNDIPSAFANEFEFETVSEQCRKINLFSAGSSKEGVSIEVPFGDDTSLIMIASNLPHPEYGPGLLTSLRLPLVLNAGEAAEIVSIINKYEIYGATKCHLLGSWCRHKMKDNDLIAYSSFMPNKLYRQGINYGCFL